MAVITHRANTGKSSARMLRCFFTVCFLFLSSGCAMIIGHGNQVRETEANNYPVRQHIHATNIIRVPLYYWNVL